MENEAITMEQMCRRLRRFRTEAIRQTVDSRFTMLREAGGLLSDSDKIDRDASKRFLRAMGSAGIESK